MSQVFYVLLHGCARMKEQGQRLCPLLFLNNMSRVVYVPARIKEQGQRLNEAPLGGGGGAHVPRLNFTASYVAISEQYDIRFTEACWINTQVTLWWLGLRLNFSAHACRCCVQLEMGLFDGILKKGLSVTVTDKVKVIHHLILSNLLYWSCAVNEAIRSFRLIQCKISSPVGQHLTITSNSLNTLPST